MVAMVHKFPTLGGNGIVAAPVCHLRKYLCIRMCTYYTSIVYILAFQLRLWEGAMFIVLIVVELL